MKIKIHGISDVRKNFDRYMQKTNKTAEDFVKEKAASASNNIYAMSLPKGKTKKQIKDIGEKMINRDLTATYMGIKRVILAVKQKNKYLVDYFSEKLKAGELDKCNEVLNNLGIGANLKSLTPEMHEANWSDGKVNYNPSAIPAEIGQIQKMQKLFLNKVGIGKTPWLMVGWMLGTKNKITKSLEREGVRPLINIIKGKTHYRIRITNPIRYASHLIKQSEILSSLRLAHSNVIKKWQMAQKRIK